MSGVGKQPLTVKVEGPPERAGGLLPGRWLRARLVDVTAVAGRHSTGYAFQFACDAGRHPGAGEVSGTVWEPVHGGRPIHHWLEVLSGRPPVIGDELDLAALAGTEVDVYCEEVAEGDPVTGRPTLAVVDLRRANTTEDD